MSFDAAAVRTLFDDVVSHAAASGYFERVNSHEPKSAPGNGLYAAVWVDGIRPVKASGLAAVSGVVSLRMRCYSSMIQQPQDAIDPNLLSAVTDLMSAYSADFALGGDDDVRCIDLLGQSGESMSVQAGYLDIDKKMYRVMTISLPVIINDMWSMT